VLPEIYAVIIRRQLVALNIILVNNLLKIEVANRLWLEFNYISKVGH